MPLESSPDRLFEAAADSVAASEHEPNAPAWTSCTRVLFTEPFDRFWELRCRSILDTVVDVCALKPLVLLPDDVQFDQYEHVYDTLYGSAALSALNSLTDGREAPAPDRFIFIDLEPVMLPLYTEFDASLHRLLHCRRPGLPMIVVATSRPECIAVSGFDHATTQAASWRVS